MKTKEALKMLCKVFSGYTFHYRFLQELSELLKNDLRGKEDRFFNCLTTQLNYIKSLDVIVHQSDGNEIIRGFDGYYYSIHLQQSQFNIRFLIHIDDNGTPIFLCAFNERAGHKKTSYEKYMDVLQARFKEMQGDDNNGQNCEM